jgi:hypothetical protein
MTMTELMRHNGFHPSDESNPSGPIPLGQQPPPPAFMPVPAPVPTSMPAPMSAPMPAPMSMPAPDHLPVPPPRPSGARATVVLGVLVAVLFLAAIASVVLYLSARGEHETAVSRLAERKGALAATSQQVASTGAVLRAADQRNGALETANADLKTCVDAVQHYLWDGLTGDARIAAVDQLFIACG